MRGLLLLVLIFGLIGPVMVTAIYRFVPPPVTWLMVQRVTEGRGFDRRWKPLDEISPRLVRAVIAAEDAKFCEHNGFDFQAIEKAYEANAKGKKLRGGSTISQQTAKNVFLWPGRSYVRKGLEAYFTVLIEVIWGKPRIMEVYLNSIEMGKGIYGAQAAAKYKFKTTAAKLSAGQCALIAATLPNPIRFDSAHPSPYIKKRQGQILRLMKLVPKFQLNEKRTKE